ncbi:MAG TPA: hypothetical protein VIV54_05555 [Burkholderiales bacterium]
MARRRPVPMQQDVYASTLCRALELHDGVIYALASELRCPDATLRRWMAGAAMMPARAFKKLVNLVMDYEAGQAATPAPELAGFKASLSFRAAGLFAQCPNCGATAFVAETSAPRLTDRLSCSSCAEPVVHGELLVALVDGLRARMQARTHDHETAGAATGKLEDGGAAL